MTRTRLAGVTLPVFSIRTRRDWGIGQITDLPACGAWLRRAGHSLLQILPPHELSSGETSPYGALTAFGIDPVYIGLEAVPEVDVPLDDAHAAELSRLRAGRHVDYPAVRKLKLGTLRTAFDRFVAREWDRATPRAKELAAFVDRESPWLEDLALYTVLREDHGGFGWETWPEDERERAPLALERVRKVAARRILEVGYQQWLALEQWAQARIELLFQLLDDWLQKMHAPMIDQDGYQVPHLL